MQRGTTCGAVVGAVAALGWDTGRTEPWQSREASAQAVREFLRRFEVCFGTLDCRTLQAVYVKDHALKSEGCTAAARCLWRRLWSWRRQILVAGGEPDKAD